MERRDVQADTVMVGNARRRPGLRASARGCEFDLFNVVSKAAVMTTSSLPRIEGIGIGEGATMSKPATAMGDMHGDDLDIENRAAARSTCPS